MTSKIKVDNINKVSDDSNIINKCGTAINVGASGNTVTVTGNDIRSDSYKAADGGVIASQSGTTITLGASGDTVTLASGASQSGFGRTGTVDWQTGSIKTSTFTATSGEGYFVNTTAGVITVNLPAGSAGDIVSLADYAATWNTYNVTVTPNGTDKIGSENEDATLSTQGQSVTFVFVDSTQGWINTMDSTSNVRGTNPFLVATGGTITTSGNFKIHTFTGPGTFTVCKVSCTAAENTVSYLAVAGGGGGSTARGGGGGAGGFREGRNNPIDPYTASPAVANAPTNAITVTATGYPITVGGGGTCGQNNPGSNSVFSTITSAGGGGAGAGPSPAGSPGGSGGGSNGRYSGSAGSGNTPPVSPSQGNNGGTTNGSGSGADTYAASGGGGIGGAGSPNPSSTQAGAGGAGLSTEISGSAVTRAGGGGGGSGSSTPSPSSSGGAGGSGGGGAGGSWPSTPYDGGNGTVNTGSGGGGGASIAPGPGQGTGGTGGSGIVIIRYKFQ